MRAQAAPRSERLDIDVDVWLARLSDFPLGECRALLTDEELSRERRFSFTLDAEMFCRSRAVRRAILAVRTGLPPSHLHFGTMSKGKPFLVEAPEVEFSISHSEGLMLLALCERGSVGVDVEYISRDVVDASISTTIFSDEEVRVLRSQPPVTRGDTFYRWWVRKEAIAKGMGEGVASMRAISMPLRPATRNESLHLGGWNVSDITVGDGYAGAVAMMAGMPVTTIRHASPAVLVASSL